MQPDGKKEKAYIIIPLLLVLDKGEQSQVDKKEKKKNYNMRIGISNSKANQKHHLQACKNVIILCTIITLI